VRVKRNRIVLILVAACALAAALGWGLDAVGVASRETAIGAGLAAWLAALASAVTQQRMTNWLDQRAALREATAKGIYLLNRRLPRVSELIDPVEIGAHPAAERRAAEGRPADRAPAYVLRDVDRALREALSESGFTLLVGDATAGKTRTAYEAMRAVLPGHVFIAPSSDGVAAAVAEAQSRENCVLWLDDLQVFLSPGGGITRKDIAGLLTGAGHHRVVLATMRAIDESRLTGGGPGAAGAEPNGQFIRIGQNVLDQVRHRFFVERLFSVDEQARARDLASSDPRLADAVSHAGHSGIGEYLAWGPQLYNQWEDAWARRHRPRAAALIAAAVDCRHAGFTGPLPRHLLDALHDGYLEDRGGDDLSPEDPDAAWGWALAPRESGSAPLRRVGADHCDVFDYLVDESRRREGGIAPEATARAALEHASPGDAGSIAGTAWRQRRHDLAEVALRRQYAAVSRDSGVDAPVVLAIRNNLAIMLQVRHRLAEAEAEYRAILAEAMTGSLDLLQVRSNLAAVLNAQYRLSEAEAEYRAIFAALAAQPPPVTRLDVLKLRNNFAALLAVTGRLDEAEAEFGAVLEVRTRDLGPDHPLTRNSRDNLAAVRDKLRDLLARGKAEWWRWLLLLCQCIDRPIELQLEAAIGWGPRHRTE
jgi:tetratricopeptide (TPR) repeat protein